MPYDEDISNLGDAPVHDAVGIDGSLAGGTSHTGQNDH
jgi:hypothetical protein